MENTIKEILSNRADYYIDSNGKSHDIIRGHPDDIMDEIVKLFAIRDVSSSASRHFLFAATFKLDTYETATQNFGHVRKIDFPTITNLKDVVRSYHKKANNIVILSISEVKEDEFKRFFSEQD